MLAVNLDHVFAEVLVAAAVAATLEVQLVDAGLEEHGMSHPAIPHRFHLVHPIGAAHSVDVHLPMLHLQRTAATVDPDMDVNIFEGLYSIRLYIEYRLCLSVPRVRGVIVTGDQAQTN
jgi:hypothetical protein